MSSDQTRPTLAPLDDKAEQWIERAINSMRGYLRETGRLRDDEAVTPEVLDDAWIDLRRRWRSSDSGEEAIKDAINQVGLTFGQLLVDQLGMEWVIATDNHGTDFAVRRGSGWVVHPRDVVKKRYANDEGGFLTALFGVLQARP